MIGHLSFSLSHLLATYGYWAVLLFVAMESTGIPFPGETMLVAAAIYAGTTHHLQIGLLDAQRLDPDEQQRQDRRRAS